MKDNTAVDLDDFRITSPVEILALLRQLQEGHVLVTLSGPGGAGYATLLWSIDAQRQTISFNAEEGDNRLLPLLEGSEVVATAYLDNIKIEFDLDGLIRVHGGQQPVLNGRLPQAILRFQRRSAFRVQPLSRLNPTAHFHHPSIRDMALSLRVLDVSLCGVALFLPDNVPMIPAGVRIGQCEIKLDEETRLDVSLIIHHVTVINPESKGSRLGCEITGLDRHDRSLQHYINQTQKRRLAMPEGKR